MHVYVYRYYIYIYIYIIFFIYVYIYIYIYIMAPRRQDCDSTFKGCRPFGLESKGASPALSHLSEGGMIRLETLIALKFHKSSFSNSI